MLATIILITTVADVDTDLNQAAALIAIDVDVAVAADAVAVVLDSSNPLRTYLKREQKDFFLQLSFLLTIINWKLHKFFH